MLAVPSGTFNPVGATPQHVADEAQVLAVLRQELRVSHEDPDGDARPPIEPMYRSVDADTLDVLRHPSYPLLVCEEAPRTYMAPTPYDAVGVAAALTRKLNNLEEHLQTVYRSRSRSRPRARCVNNEGIDRHRYNDSNSDNNSDDDDDEDYKIYDDDSASEEDEDLMDFFLSVLDRDADFAHLMRDVSVLRWYLRWAASHSLAKLDRAREQIEYVLSEFGLPDAAEMAAATQCVPFATALIIIEADRHDVIEAERRRLSSKTRTFRARLSPMVVTSATNSYLTAEEKYRLQEFYNETEHAISLLKHAVRTQNALASNNKNSNNITNKGGGGGGGGEESIVRSRATSMTRAETPRGLPMLLSSSPLNGHTGATIDANDEDYVQQLSDAAMRTMRREREEINALLRVIREREACGAVVGITADAHSRNRLALTTVYKRVLDDAAMLRAHVQTGTSFLTWYDAWLSARCGKDHFTLLSRLPLCAPFPPPPLSSSSLSPPRGVISGTASLTPQRHAEDVSNELTKLLRRRLLSISPSAGNSASESEAPLPMLRRRLLLGAALRFTAEQMARGFWQPEALRAGMDDIAARLARFAAASEVKGTGDGVDVGRSFPVAWAANLALVLRCFIGLICVARRDLSHDAVVDVRVALRGSGDSVRSSAMERSNRQNTNSISSGKEKDEEQQGEEEEEEEKEDNERWAAVFDALWEQASPADAALSGVFLRADHIALPLRTPRNSLNNNNSSNSNISNSYSGPILTSSLPDFITVRYTLQDDRAALDGKSFAKILRENSLLSPSLSSSNSTSIATRYGYVRHVLQVLLLLEQRQQLCAYACRPQEVDFVQLEDIVILSRKPKSAVVVGLLPPAAVRLMRLSAASARMPLRGSHSESRGKKALSVSLFIAGLLRRVATGGPQVLEQMSAIAEAAHRRAQGLERNDDAVTAAIVRPMLRALDEYIESPKFNAALQEADVGMKKRTPSKAAHARR